MENETIKRRSPVSRPRFSPADSRASPGPAEAAEKDGQSQISVIGTDIKISGDIEASADLVIEGTIHGDVKCATLIVGEEGRVIGNIAADRLRLSGMVEGTIETHDLAIESNAEINGDVLYSRLRVASGGVISGHMTCRQDSEEKAKPNGNGFQENHRPEEVAVFEDSSYRNSQRTSGNGKS